MRLKKLEVFGFKSFSEKTVVAFQPGINAIVGPNGCGKSNIVDAILWAMGEQSAKTLRGDRMEDVIFNGSSQRKPLSMSEATLTISGLQGELPSAFGGYTEVEITRRLFRSGESEYLINKVPCRLKDIRELLIDTGAGFKGHTIIEQGRIDQILQASPVDRRAIIEEAAGILKYRVRKTEALRKLESTEQNLLRVRDIISEVRRQINALERQAQRAKRQAEILSEIKKLEILLYGIKYSDFKKELDKAVSQEESLLTEEAEKLATLSSLESSLQAHQLDRLDGETDLSRIREELFQIDKEIHVHEGKIAVLTNQVHTCMEQSERLSGEIEENRQQIQELNRQREEGTQVQAGFELEIFRMQESLSGQETSFTGLTAAFHQARKDLESARIQLFSKLTGMTETKNRAVALESKLEELVRRKERIETERQETTGNLGTTQSSITQERNDVSGMADILVQCRSDQDITLQALGEVEQNLAGLRQQIDFQKGELHKKEARFHSLSEIEKNLVGYQEGVRSILLSRENHPEELPGIFGIVAHILETQPAYEKAIEAVLGERLQHLVVEGEEAGRQAVSYLKKQGSGRGTFIPRQPKDKQISEATSTRMAEEGVVGEAVALVHYPQTYRNVVDYLLKDVWIVENIDTAFRLFERNQNDPSGPNRTWVTLDGDVLNTSGILSGGDATASLPNLMPKRRELKDLQREIQVLQEKMTSLEQTLSQQSSQQAALKTQHDRQEEEKRGMELQLSHKEKDLQVLADQEGRLLRHLQTLSTETAEIENTRITLQKELEEIHKELLEQESQKQIGEEELARLQETQNNVSHQWETAQQDLLSLKTTLASHTEKYQSQLRHLQELSRNRESVETAIREKESEMEHLAGKKSGYSMEQGEVEKKLEEFRQKSLTVRGEIQKKEIAQADLANRIHEVEAQLRACRETIEQLRVKKGQCEIKKTELRMELDHIQEYLKATYDIGITDTLLPQAPILEPTLAETGTLSEETKSSETLAIRLTEWKDKLHRLGPVNPAAIEEFQELQTRYEFLTQQEGDLTGACETLQKTIDKINQTTREMFLEAFNALNKNFQEVFQRLFREGSAKLVLTDENRVLESGIEIVAHPAGKTVNHLSLLSGGEKALTAIAILFASFLVRPTPFCVLDEIDAPLDEANTGRFLEALKSMTDRSQFIVITHNKRTMETADILYGITMEEPGVSRLLSVNLSRESAVEEETVAA